MILFSSCLLRTLMATRWAVAWRWGGATRIAQTVSILIFLSVLPASAFTESDLQKYLGWNKGFSSADSIIASWPKTELFYNSLGGQSGAVNDLISEYFFQISQRTGVSITRQYSGHIDIAIVVDNNVLIDLHDKTWRFRTLGLHDSYILSMKNTNPRPDAPGGVYCAREFFSSDNNDIRFAIVMSQNTSRACIVGGILGAMGIKASEGASDIEMLNMACVIYAARHLGARTMSEILKNKEKLEVACDERNWAK